MSSWHDVVVPRLLIIDDDRKLVELLVEYLEPQGFTIDAAHDGVDGLRSALGEPPDLVILDLMLPGVDGLEVCRRLRAEAREPVPILMLSARGDETDRIVGLELGADDYLPKPFNPRELLARIRAVLRRAETPATGDGSACIELGALRLYPASRRVLLRGDAVELTSSEFDLLTALARSAGRVLSRDQLLQEVHGPGWAAYSRSVDVHISRLRSKIEDDSRHPQRLKTIRGAGYMLCRPSSSENA